MHSEDAAAEPNRPRPLCVDLDGTLIYTDSLVECALQLIRRNPLNLFRLVLWLFSGLAALKQQVALRSKLQPSLLPYNQPLLRYLRECKGHRPLVLVTGSNRLVADAVATHVGIFDEVLASDESRNLTASTKRDVLKQRFGAEGFDYIGNSADDIVVWQAAQASQLVAAEGRFAKKARRAVSFEREWIRPRPGFRTYAKAIRVHQWTKNLLIFIPLMLEHRAFDVTALLALATCFACLSLFASATYLINDLLDLDADRQNSTKRHRALAAGIISPVEAVAAIVLLLIATAYLVQYLPHAFAMVLLLYGVITLAYSLYLKQVMIVDVSVLAALFTLRIIGGGSAIQVEVSFWLLAFSMFFFLSLAMGKRASELANANREQKTVITGRGYRPSDLAMLSSAGTSAGFMSVLVVALYINSDTVLLLYDIPEALWLVCPLLLYWVSRFWLIVSRGGMHEDPIIFAIRDRVSLLTVAICALIVVLATVAPGLL